METPARGAASYVQAALDLTPDVRQLHQEIERDRMLPPALVTTMTDAGFFSLWLSRTFGGPELSFTDCARVLRRWIRRLVCHGGDGPQPAIGLSRGRRRA